MGESNPNDCCELLCVLYLLQFGDDIGCSVASDGLCGTNGWENRASSSSSFFSSEDW